MTLRELMNTVKENQNTVIIAEWSKAGFYRYETVSDIARIFHGREVLSISTNKNNELVIEVA